MGYEILKNIKAIRCELDEIGSNKEKIRQILRNEFSDGKYMSPEMKTEYLEMKIKALNEIELCVYRIHGFISKNDK